MNNRKDERNDDGGYGNGSLVGSDRSGLKSAIEARQAVDAARARADDASDVSEDADLGRLADTSGTNAMLGTSADSSAGPGTLGDSFGGTRALAGRNDADRDSRDGGNSLQE